MSKREDVERFVNDTAAHFGGLDILVNNAGDAAVGRTIEDSDEVWEQTYDINLWSAVRATRAAVPLIREQGGGSIVNVASVSGHSGLGGMADYNSAKAAMLAMTKTLAQDLAGDGIRVNAVNPALIHTPLWNAWRRTASSARWARTSTRYSATSPDSSCSSSATAGRTRSRASSRSSRRRGRAS